LSFVIRQIKAVQIGSFSQPSLPHSKTMRMYDS
jgi:hypothetical protein